MIEAMIGDGVDTWVVLKAKNEKELSDRITAWCLEHNLVEYYFDYVYVGPG